MKKKKTKMKLSRYIKLETESGFDYTLTLKKWGLPFLFFKVMKKNFHLKWYHWITIYPYICLKTMIGDNNG